MGDFGVVEGVRGSGGRIGDVIGGLGWGEEGWDGVG